MPLSAVGYPLSMDVHLVADLVDLQASHGTRYLRTLSWSMLEVG